MTHNDVLGKLGNVSRPVIWFALFGAPLVWFAQMNLGLAFTPLACGGTVAPLVVLHTLVLLVVLASLLVSLRLRGLQGQPQGAPARITAYLGRFGAWQNALFLLLTAINAIAAIFLQACRLH